MTAFGGSNKLSKMERNKYIRLHRFIFRHGEVVNSLCDNGTTVTIICQDMDLLRDACHVEGLDEPGSKLSFDVMIILAKGDKVVGMNGDMIREIVGSTVVFPVSEEHKWLEVHMKVSNADLKMRFFAEEWDRSVPIWLFPKVVERFMYKSWGGQPVIATNYTFPHRDATETMVSSMVLEDDGIFWKPGGLFSFRLLLVEDDQIRETFNAIMAERLQGRDSSGHIESKIRQMSSH